MKYKMVHDTKNGELAWYYDFDMQSADMAIGYAGRVAMQINHDLTLFTFRDDWYPVARIRVVNEVSFKAITIPE